MIISAVFPPVSTSGIHRVVRATRYLTEMGVDVTVLTVDEKTLPKSFSYDHNVLEKSPPSVAVHRVPAIQALRKLIDLKNRGENKGSQGSTQPSAKAVETAASENGASKKSTAQTIKDAITLNLNTPDNFSMWIRPAIKAGTQIVQHKGITNIFSSSPPGSVHVVANQIKKRTGARWIADFRDPWSRKRWFNPEMTAFKNQAIKRFERRTIQNADKLIMNTAELLEDFGNHYGPVIQRKSTVITNGFDPADFGDLPEPNGKADDRLTICHTGTFYRQRSPMPFLQGLKRAVDSGVPKTRFRVQFIGGVGDHKPNVDKFISENDFGDVIEIIPSIPHRDCLIAMREADVLLIVQPVTTIQIPAKIFEYIATGKPILTLSALGATSNVVTKNELGWWADFDSEEQIGERIIEIEKFFSNPENRNWKPKQEALDRFNGKILVERMFDLLS